MKDEQLDLSAYSVRTDLAKEAYEMAIDLHARKKKPTVANRSSRVSLLKKGRLMRSTFPK